MGRAERRSLATLPRNGSGILSCDQVSVCSPSSFRALFFNPWSGELRMCQKDRCSGHGPHSQNQNGRLHMARMLDDRWHVHSRGFFAVKAWDVQSFNTSEIATEITHSSRVASMLFLWDRFLPTLFYLRGFHLTIICLWFFFSFSSFSSSFFLSLFPSSSSFFSPSLLSSSVVEMGRSWKMVWFWVTAVFPKEQVFEGARNVRMNQGNLGHKVLLIMQGLRWGPWLRTTLPRAKPILQ